MTNQINKKLPHECSDITEVRHEIDNIDFEIIRLLSSRLKYVHEVVKYKENTPEAIVASDRRAAVISSRRAYAVECGIHPDVVEDIYRTLIQYCIDEEKKLKNII